MARPGEIAKEKIESIMRLAFKDRFLGVQDKKLYIMIPDGEHGETQISITLTCPKTGIDADYDSKAEIFDQEAIVLEMMEALGLPTD